MANLLIAGIWAAYGVVVACLISISVGLIYYYQSRRESSPPVVYVCITSLLALLATVLLLPTDVALVSTTATRVSLHNGVLTPHYGELDDAISSLKIVYRTLYSINAVLCFFVIPMAYFWYEEYDEIATEDGTQTHLRRLWTAFKGTLTVIALVLVIILAAAALEVAAVEHKSLPGLGVFWKLLTEHHCERFVLFVLGFLTTCGTLAYVVYTSTGIALVPISLLKAALSSSVPAVAEASATSLEYNNQRQHHLRQKCRGNLRALSSRDRGELEALTRQEKVLRRRLRLMEAERLHEQSLPMLARMRLSMLLEPLNGILGLLLLGISFLIFLSVFFSSIDKVKNALCGTKCFSSIQVNMVNPLNFILTKSAKIFPLDLVLFTLLTVFLLGSSFCGIAMIGLRLFWVKIFAFRRGRTCPQALLLITLLLAFIGLALNYALPVIIAPQYATFGSQRYCDHSSSASGRLSDCANGLESFVKLCFEHDTKPLGKGVCTPSVSSSLLADVSAMFPVFGILNTSAQVAFLVAYIIGFVIIAIKTPEDGLTQIDEDAEEAEEEHLLSHDGRAVSRTWNDLVSRSTSIHGATSYGSIRT
ncbi:LMBR1-like membrane protein [Ascosphaera apis ARSEF 7405]|uniref:Probable lysosomal cobalamin transporter n=1 Tax=Ascosphaera apis ARSEF 7405 TaxID=392613 RepID=A0A167ZVV4_9EURO|nr:LMBR1-like membrane protein [Ascosphaera apis ARSEF 7405]